MICVLFGPAKHLCRPVNTAGVCDTNLAYICIQNVPGPKTTLNQYLA